MRKLLKANTILVFLAVATLCLTACADSRDISSVSQTTSQSTTESVQEEKIIEYFAEVPGMQKPDEEFGAKYLKEDDGIYYYSLSSDSESAVAAMQMYMATLMNSGFSIGEIEGTTYYNVYKDDKQISLLGLAKDGSEYVLAVAFFD